MQGTWGRGTRLDAAPAQELAHTETRGSQSICEHKSYLASGLLKRQLWPPPPPRGSDSEGPAFLTSPPP